MISPSNVPKPFFPPCSKRIHFAIYYLPVLCKGSVIQMRGPFLIVVLMSAPAIMHCIIRGVANARPAGAGEKGRRIPKFWVGCGLLCGTPPADETSAFAKIKQKAPLSECLLHFHTV